MKNKWTKTILISMLAVLVMAIGAIGVFAQTDDAAPAEKATGMDQFHGRGRGGFPHGAGGDRQAELAEALGITVEELEAAQQEARAARINQLVEDGTLTLDQANLMLAMDALKQNIDRGTLMAGALDLSVEEFEAAREDGTLRDLLADITPAELQEKAQAAFEDALQQAVKDNIITADQAELIRENMDEGFGFGAHRGFGGHACPGGFGGHARPGGFGGRDKGNLSAPEDLQNTFAPSV
jgi:hypothetical protein